jgi:hypothetical protein
MVDEIGHAAKHLGKWRDVVGHRAPPSAMGWSGPDPVIGQPECVLTSGRWLVAGRLLGARGRPSSPWPGSAPGQRQKQPAFSGCFGQAVRGGVPPVGHSYMNVKGQEVVTAPSPVAFMCCSMKSALVRVRSSQRDASLTAMTPSSWRDRRSVLRPVVPEIRNSNHGLRVLLGKPSHNRSGRTTNC